MASQCIGGILILLFGMASTVLSLRLFGGSAEELGAGFFPFWVSAGICAIGAVNLITLWLQRKRISAHWPSRSGWLRLGAALGLFVGYYVALPRLGFAISTFAMVAFFTRLIFDRSWVLSLLLSAGIALMVQGLLSVVLGVRLPSAPWGGPWTF